MGVVVVPSGYEWPWEKRREVLELIGSGLSARAAAGRAGVSAHAAEVWWRGAGGPKLPSGGRGRGGLRRLPDRARVGGRGHRLNGSERQVIARGVARGASYAEIGAWVGRDKSVVYREVARHGGRAGYVASLADVVAMHRAARPKPFKLDRPELAAVVAENMDVGWSPKLVADWLRQLHPGDRSRWVSHETIYQALYVQGRGALRADLHKQLSTGRDRRRPRTHVERRGNPFGEALKISQRPPEVTDRAVPGHWEGDLILGSGGTSAIGTLVERSTRFTLLLHLEGDHTSQRVAAAMITAMSTLPAHLRRSLTWDRGTEMARWKDISLDLQMPVYFADPRSPWQRGSNENTNRLLRFWFTKGTDLSHWTPEQVQTIQNTLNARPRPTLDLKTPAQALAELLETAA